MFLHNKVKYLQLVQPFTTSQQRTTTAANDNIDNEELANEQLPAVTCQVQL